MKIVLEHGNFFYVQTCDHCKCKFLYEGVDISLEAESNDYNVYYRKVQCPECKSWMFATNVIYNHDKHKLLNI